MPVAWASGRAVSPNAGILHFDRGPGLGAGVGGDRTDIWISGEMPIGGEEAVGVGGPMGIGMGIGMVTPDGNMACATASAATSRETPLGIDSSSEGDTDLRGCIRLPVRIDCAEGGGEIGRDHMPSVAKSVGPSAPAMLCDMEVRYADFKALIDMSALSRDSLIDEGIAHRVSSRTSL